MEKTYRNYQELLEDNEKLAKELLDNRDNGKWQKEEIHYYSDKEAFAEYELTEGWYASLELERDFNGAPNPLDFINLKELGTALIRNWDDSTNYKANDGSVLQTRYGW